MDADSWSSSANTGEGTGEEALATLALERRGEEGSERVPGDAWWGDVVQVFRSEVLWERCRDFLGLVVEEEGGFIIVFAWVEVEVGGYI
jgi:hypothetical protein